MAKYINDGGIYMSAQIASTPIIHGPEAKKFYKEANHEPSMESKNGTKKLVSFFDQIINLE